MEYIIDDQVNILENSQIKSPMELMIRSWLKSKKIAIKANLALEYVSLGQCEVICTAIDELLEFPDNKLVPLTENVWRDAFYSQTPAPLTMLCEGGGALHFHQAIMRIITLRCMKKSRSTFDEWYKLLNINQNTVSSMHLMFHMALVEQLESVLIPRYWEMLGTGMKQANTVADEKELQTCLRQTGESNGWNNRLSAAIRCFNACFSRDAALAKNCAMGYSPSGLLTNHMFGKVCVSEIMKCTRDTSWRLLEPDEGLLDFVTPRDLNGLITSLLSCTSSMIRFASEMRRLSGGPTPIIEITENTSAGSSYYPDKLNPMLLETIRSTGLQADHGLRFASALLGRHGEYDLNVWLLQAIGNIFESISYVANGFTQTSAYLKAAFQADSGAGISTEKEDAINPPHSDVLKPDQSELFSKLEDFADPGNFCGTGCSYTNYCMASDYKTPATVFSSLVDILGFRSLTESTILDAGSCDGYVAGQFNANAGGRRLTMLACDLFQESVDAAMQSGHYVYGFQQDLTQPHNLPRSSIDIMVVLGVTSRLIASVQTLEHWRAVLKPSGLLVVSVRSDLGEWKDLLSKHPMFIVTKRLFNTDYWPHHQIEQMRRCDVFFLSASDRGLSSRTF